MDYHRAIAWHMIEAGFDVHLVSSGDCARVREAISIPETVRLLGVLELAAFRISTGPGVPDLDKSRLR